MKFGNQSSSALLLSSALMLGLSLPVLSEPLKGAAVRTSGQSQKTYLQKHPVVKRAAIGAGVGTAAGALTGLVTGKGVMRGAAIGAGTGAGVGMIKSSKTLKAHPVAGKVATGTAIGLGVGLAANRGEHKGKKIAAATGIGAAIGLGTGLLKDEFK